MKQERLYLVLAIIGFAGPYYFFISFLAAYGFDGKAFLEQLFGTPISAFFAVDLLLSCVVFLVFLRREARRYFMGRPWVYVVFLATVGLSLAFPLFLYFRDRHLEVKSVAGGEPR